MKSRRKSVLDKRTTYATYAAYDENGQQKTMVTSYVQAYEKNIDIQNREIAFDKHLREKANVKETSTAQQRHKFQKKWLSLIKNIVMVFYFAIIPAVVTPDWCLSYYDDHFQD